MERGAVICSFVLFFVLFFRSILGIQLSGPCRYTKRMQEHITVYTFWLISRLRF